MLLSKILFMRVDKEFDSVIAYLILHLPLLSYMEWCYNRVIQGVNRLRHYLEHAPVK